ncbi:MAG: dTMP kinase [Parcubacteria group bacterium]
MTDLWRVSLPSKMICIESIDKGGKGTVMRGLWVGNEVGTLRFPKGVVFTAEPYESCLMGQEIRKVLTHKLPAPNAYDLQRMFVINRAVHQQCVVRPALAAGKIVICDRGPWSTLVYGIGQTYPDGPPPDDSIKHFLDTDQIIELHNRIIGPNLMVWPDLVVYLDIAAEVAMQRSQSAVDPPQYFEKYEVLERVRRNYRELIAGTTLRGQQIGHSDVVVIDGNQPREDVLRDVITAIRDFLRIH